MMLKLQKKYSMSNISPQYIDLTTDGNETDITHISETQIPQNLT